MPVNVSAAASRPAGPAKTGKKAKFWPSAQARMLNGGGIQQQAEKARYPAFADATALMGNEAVMRTVAAR